MHLNFKKIFQVAKFSRAVVLDVKVIITAVNGGWDLCISYIYFIYTFTLK